jgi:hypothetical protein
MRPASLSPIAALAPFVAGALGCTGAVGGADTPRDADSAVTQAIVLVERTLDPVEGVRATASARFARVAAGTNPSDTLQAVGAGLAIPPGGSCAAIRPVESTATEPSPVVELLDMGRVSIEAEGTVTALVPRQLPYVTDVVTGTIYARAADANVLPAGAPYVVHVAGSGELPAFDVTATAPDDASDVAIAQETAPGKVTATDASIDFSWSSNAQGSTGSPSPSSLARGDVLYVEVQPAGVRCTLGDGVGETARHASIPSSLLDDAGTLTVHRMHAEPLVARGIDGGELRFDFARVVAYTRP